MSPFGILSRHLHGEGGDTITAHDDGEEWRLRAKSEACDGVPCRRWVDPMLLRSPYLQRVAELAPHAVRTNTSRRAETHARRYGRKGSPIACVERRLVYRSAAQAGDAIHLNPNGIFAVLDRPTATCGGCHWERWDREKHAGYRLVEPEPKQETTC